MPRLGPLLVLLVLAGQAAPVAAGVGEGDDLIAFCRPPPADTVPPCICSVEQVEVALTGGEFLRHVAALRAAGALGAAEFAAAVSQEQRACGAAPATASPLAEARGRMGLAPGPRPADMAAHARRAGVR